MRMEECCFSIRKALPADAVELLGIYAPYIERTAVTFEYTVPSPFEFRQRIEATLEKYPWLVACDSAGKALGYAYAGKLKQRAAYAWAAELSVYVDVASRRTGIGSALYAELQRLLKLQNVTNLYACITYSDIEDELHDNSSQRFHEKEGFAKIAHFHNCGFKFARWWDMIWMEKFITPHHAVPQPFVPFPKIV